MGKVADIEAKLRKYSAPYYDESRLPFTPVKARGEWIYAFVREKNGSESFKALLDLHNNYSAIGLGHNHPELVELKMERLDAGRPALISFGEAVLEETAELEEAIVQLSGLDRVVFKNAGAEAFESAVKIAALWGHCAKDIPENQYVEVIVAHNNFHGRTLAATAASTSDIRKDGFGPFEEGRPFRHVPFDDIEALRQAITQNTGAIILEPIQAEAGVIVPSPGYLKAVRQLCNESNALFILDEVQTGMGRTGKLFAWQHEGEEARPDGMMLGKNLGGGANIVSMLVLREDVAQLLGPGKEGSTFGGNAEACAVALKTLEILRRPGFIKRIRILGEAFMGKLRLLNSPLIREVRGRGLLIAVEFVPEAGGAKYIQEKLFRAGILSLARGEHIIGFSPPLITSEHNLLVFGVHRIGEVFRALEKERGVAGEASSGD